MSTGENASAAGTHGHNALGHLASAVGHHVINAFSAVVSNAEMLRLRSKKVHTPEELTAVAEGIVQTALEASTVARRLIDFTRPVTGVGPDEVRVDELVAEFVAEQRESGPANVTWETELQPVPPIAGNRDHLRAMLRHLATNAVEAAAGSPLTIRATTGLDARGWVMLELIDSGPGMTPEVQERAVEPFFTTKPGHTGVGLSVANGIWRRHRGTLSLRGRPGEGTAVRLCVEPPIAPAIRPKG